MQIIESGECYALCEGMGARRRVDMRLVGPQAAGTWLLVFRDAAREVMDALRAREVESALGALDLALRGEDPAAGFADLIDREPQLPPHLK
jgi:hydrogenase expression/formation protein HypC